MFSAGVSLEADLADACLWVFGKAERQAFRPAPAWPAGKMGVPFVRDPDVGIPPLAMTGRYVNRDADPLRALSDAVEGRIMAALEVGTGRRKTAVVVQLSTTRPRKR